MNPSFLARSSLYKIFKLNSDFFKNLKVLDVGCGAKPYQVLFKDSKSYIGVDTNYSGHDHANENIDVFYDGKVLPFPESSYDAVVSFQVLEHVENENLFLREINRVLVHGGVVMLSFPFCWSEHEQPYDFRRISSFGAKKLLEANGFKITEIIKTTNHLQTIIQLLNTYLSMKFKTRFAVVNILMSLSYVPLLNFIGLICGLISKNHDLFCDLVVIAKKAQV